MGAMENVGCITFSERMVFRDPPTDLQRLSRAEVVLHEMAHMWFGDLVTMRWWDDLWLNESFATYMAYVAMEEATRFGAGVWPNFHGRMKAWAYEQDQLVTTHPIAGDVLDTDATFQNFDGITYGKGASVLKQLVAAIGKDGFRDGMRHYFKTYAWGNTTLAEFLGALETGSGKELSDWSQKWLEQAGVNTLAARIEASDDTVSAFAIEQTAPADHPTLRPHKLELAVYDESADGAPVLREAIPVEVDGPRTVVEDLVSTAVPVAVFPNYDDHDFAKTELDPQSLAFIRERLERFDDSFVRTLFWHSLWDMVRDRQFTSLDYLALVREKLPHESNLELVQTTIRNANLAQRAYTPNDHRLAEGRGLYALAQAELAKADDADLRIVWARSRVAAAQEPDTIEEMLHLADNGTGIDGFDLDQEMRWSLAVKAASHGLPGAEARIAQELERDPSDRGRRSAETARVAAPDTAVKEAAWTAIHQDDQASFHDLRAQMQGLFWWHQAELTAPYVERFFQEVAGIFAAKTPDFSSAYLAILFPHHLPNAETVARTEAVLATLTDDDGMARRGLRESLDELQRAKACREFATS
jgi:aminopeptidase N